MKVDQLLALDSDEQFDWLKLKYAAKEGLADEDIEFHITLMAWDDPLGSIVTPDPINSGRHAKIPRLL